jgi:hypothetical protein
MVIWNEELNFIVLSQIYSIIDWLLCFLLFQLILIVIYVFL